MDQQESVVQEESAQEELKKAIKGEGFFSVSLNQIDELVRLGGGANELMAYLVLARGAGKSTASQWSRKAISKYTQMTYTQADKAIEWLKEKEFIEGAIAFNPAKPTWQIKPADDIEVAMANTFIEGVGKGKNNPPLCRIEDVALSNYGRAAARLDTLMVLLHLYKHHLLAEYGGVSPLSGIYRKWEGTGVQIPIDRTNINLFEISGENSVMYLDFAAESLFYVADIEERHERFWDAFHNITKMGWLYETIQIWNADPSKDSKAEPLYPLYIFDRHARENDPCLSRAIHNAAFRTGSMDGYSQFSYLEGDRYIDSEDIVGTGRFRYVVHPKLGGFPIGIYRLRFRPNTNDTGKGMAAEQRRVNEWTQFLDKLEG